MAMGDIVETNGNSVMALGRHCLALSSTPIPAYVDFGQLDRSLRIVSLGTSRTLLSWCASPHERVSCCAVSQDGRCIVTAGRDEGTWVWQLSWTARTRCELQKEQSCLQNQTAQISSLAVCSVNSMVVGGGTEGQVMVWNLHTRALLWQDVSSIGSGEVRTAISAGCGCIVGGAAQALVVWSGSGVPLAQISLPRYAPISSLVCTQQGEMLRSNLFCTGHADGKLRAFRLDVPAASSVCKRRWGSVVDRLQSGMKPLTCNTNLPFELQMERCMAKHKDTVSVLKLSRGESILFSADTGGQPMMWPMCRLRERPRHSCSDKMSTNPFDDEPPQLSHGSSDTPLVL